MHIYLYQFRERIIHFQWIKSVCTYVSLISQNLKYHSKRLHLQSVNAYMYLLL